MQSDLMWLSPFLIRLERRQQSNGLNDHAALFNDCACALVETLLFMVQSHCKSCVFPYGTRWRILAQNT